MNKNIVFWVNFVFAVGIHEYNFALSEHERSAEYEDLIAEKDALSCSAGECAECIAEKAEKYAAECAKQCEKTAEESVDFAQRRSLREVLQEKWDDSLAKQKKPREESCRSMLLGLAALQDMETVIKNNHITTVFWRNRSKFAEVEFWFYSPYGSLVRLDNLTLKELLKEAVVHYDGSTDNVEFDTQRYAIDSLEDIFAAQITDFVAKRRKSLESGLEKLRCSEFETQTDSN